jgi:hypothetical protein
LIVTSPVNAVVRREALANENLFIDIGLPIIANMRYLRLPILLLLVTCSAKAATLSGTVLDSEGAVISNAHVIVHWDSSGSNYLKDNHGITQDITVTSDSNGHFSLELAPGFYDVFVTATAFSPHCEKIRLKGTEVKSYEIKLKVSRILSIELD